MYEKVNPAHPDKIADRIAGAIVDMAYNEDTNPKIAVEVLVGHVERADVRRGAVPGQVHLERAGHDVLVHPEQAAGVGRVKLLEFLAQRGRLERLDDVFPAASLGVHHKGFFHVHILLEGYLYRKA